jgi:D-methionine transport system substrate-binding protein
MKARGYSFVAIGKSILLPLAIYGADHVTSLDAVKHGAKVLISVDPSNGARSLNLLEKAGLITLSNHINPTPKDIAHNPHGLKIIEAEAPLLPRLLKDDADLAVIISDWVIVSGMDANKALFKEDINAPYANLIVVKQGNENRDDIKKFVALYQSDDVKKFIQDTFKGAILPAW